TIPHLYDAAVSGELVAVSSTDDFDRIWLYDADSTAGTLSLRRFAKVIGTVRDTFTFTGDLLEWGDFGYHNARIPLSNAVGIEPNPLPTETSTIGLRVAGAASAWRFVSLDVKDANAQPLGGSSRLVGQTVEFTPAGSAYQVGGARYDVKLFNPPTSVIDGGDLTFDLPWTLPTAGLFGVAQVELVSLTPSVAVRGQATAFRLRGNGLDRVTELRVGSQVISGFTSNANGSEIAFTTTLSTVGFYGVRVLADGVTSELPLAVVVADPLAVTTATTNNPRGSDRVSEAGGNQVTLTGGGFAGRVNVHFFPSTGGHSPDDTNRMSPVTLVGGALRFASPACQTGLRYAVAVVNVDTGQRADASGTLLCIDDVAPGLTSEQGLTYTKPYRLTYNEPVTVTGFNVTATFFDYSGRPPADVSSDFELFSSGSVVEVRQRSTESVQHNREYRVTVNGITDANGNLAAGGGARSFVFRTLDTLAPRNLRLVRTPDNTVITASTVLTKTRTYTFRTEAADNLDTASILNLSVRVSPDNGLTFGSPRNGASFSVPVDSADQFVALRVRATDNSGNFTEETFTLGTREPLLDISGVQTAPILPEEGQKSDVYFLVSGADADLVNSASLTIHDTVFTSPAINVLAGGVREIRVPSFENPKLAAAVNGVRVRLLLAYGVDGLRTVDDSYAIASDRTPPTIAIVAPENGARVPVGQATNVVIRSFDSFGIESVRISLDGGPLGPPLSDPS
ncbi:MAG TPA: Ig-like domain-containing protein, partial [Polyangiaceae bacterium]